MSDLTHLYVTARGGFTTHPDEDWMCGIRFGISTGVTAPDDVGTLGPLADAAVTVHRTEALWNISSEFNVVDGVNTFHIDDWLNDELAPAWTAFMAAAPICSKVRLDSLRVAPITAAGTTADHYSAALQWSSANPHGGAADNMMPAETSCAVSWQTNNVGRKGKGRIYLPPFPGGTMDSDGGLLNTDATQTRDAAVALLQGMAITPLLFSPWWVIPIVTGPPWTHYGFITQVKVGHVFDSQRRRRDSNPEAPVSAPVTYP